MKKAKKYLNNNNCIAVPTETVYGLAANAYSDNAVKRIFKLKKRPKSNPLIVHYSKITDLKKDCILNKHFLKLYKKFSPGPITFILKLKKTSQICGSVTNNKKTLAVRFPRHKILKKLLNQIDFPLAAPSANVSNRLSSVEASDVKEEFGKKISYILDGGKSKIGLESTIIDLTKSPKILRLGGLEFSKIEKALNKKIKININPLIKNVPGQSRLHYSPGIPLRMNALKAKKNEAFIFLKKQKNHYSNYFYLSKKNDLNEAARNLYSCLRQIKNKGFRLIAVEKISNLGLGRTINDRLNRASKY